MSLVDDTLPSVVFRAWEKLRATYDLDSLEGPTRSEALNRDANLWSVLAEVGDDIATFDVYVIDGPELPQGVYTEDFLGKTKYFARGTRDEPGHRELTKTQVRAKLRQLPSRIRVVIAGGGENYTHFNPYRSGTHEDLAAAIAEGLEKVGWPKLKAS